MKTRYLPTGLISAGLLFSIFLYSFTVPFSSQKTFSESSPSLTVFVFLDTECPLSQNYTLQLREIQAKFAEEEVQFVAVFPAQDDRKQQIKAFIKKYQLPFETLRDPKHRWVDSLAATITPEVFLVDESGQVLYAGLIDNWIIALGKKRQVITKHYLEEAISAALAATPILIPQTTAIGCFISR